uniref:Uncharacterized protein n=1 Tax=viral metagenome TaxID=1070528 RepID=A0A6C0CGL4_9ZZZZ
MVSCYGISNLTLEGITAAVDLLWLFGWWSVGHFFYWSISNCRDKCVTIEPLGIGFTFVGQVIFFWISRHVLNAFYKRELPGGEDFAKEISTMLGKQQKRKGNK